MSVGFIMVMRAVVGFARKIWEALYESIAYGTFFPRGMIKHIRSKAPFLCSEKATDECLKFSSLNLVPQCHCLCFHADIYLLSVFRLTA